MFQVGHFLLRNASVFPERTALIYKGEGISYARLNDISNRLANSLTDIGIRKGSRVAYLFKNCPQLVFIWYALQKIGATAVPLNVYLLPNEICRTLEKAECETLIYHEDFIKTVEKIAAGCSCVNHMIKSGGKTDSKTISFEKLCNDGSDSEAQIRISGSDESLLLFTSGTTGVSKGVVRSQKIIRDYALMMAVENNNSGPEILLTHCPMFHTAGLSVLMKMAALCGTMVLFDKVDPKPILEAIERYRVTQLLMVPPILYVRLAEAAVDKNYDLKSVKEARASGGSCSPDYAEKIFSLFPNAKICVSWGSTETCSPTSILISRDEFRKHPERIGSIGRINAMNELRIVDDAGNEVPHGHVGEATVRSSMVAESYLKDPELSKKSFRNGWFYTEDMMKRDDDGYYYLLDRKRDMIKTGGENVYAQEVEGVLKKHPSIEDCAVIGLPDDRFGEAVAAAIVLVPGKSIDFRELASFCQERLPSYKKPRYAAFVEELPRNSIGKIQKKILREKSATLFVRITEK